MFVRGMTSLSFSPPVAFLSTYFDWKISFLISVACMIISITPAALNKFSGRSFTRLSLCPELSCD